MSDREDAAARAVYSNLSYIKTGNFNIAAGRILQAADSVTFSDSRIRKAAEGIAATHGLTPEAALAISKNLAVRLRK